MLCYKDKTFCTYYETCAASEECTRKATPELLDEALAFGLPVAVYGEKPSCFQYDMKPELQEET